MLDIRFNILVFLIAIIGISSCVTTAKKENEPELSVMYRGWWVYGEGQHIFKDEATLSEWTLSFPNENLDDLVELYLAVCEMEYFPMECEMYAVLKQDTLIVEDFEILYIQGCGE